jgi:hypothetical protein
MHPHAHSFLHSIADPHLDWIFKITLKLMRLRDNLNFHCRALVNSHLLAIHLQNSKTPQALLPDDITRIIRAMSFQVRDQHDDPPHHAHIS